MMHQEPDGTMPAVDMDIWAYYNTQEDIQRAADWWPLSRFLSLVGSPSTTSLKVLGVDKNEGRVDFEVSGAIREGEDGGTPAKLLYSTWGGELSYEDKRKVVEVVRAFVSSVSYAAKLLQKDVADALGVKVLA